MSINLPKYTISSEAPIKQKSSKTTLLIIAVTALLFGYFIARSTFDNRLNSLYERNIVLEDLNNKNQQEVSAHKVEISLLKTELKVKKEAIAQMQYDYKKLIAQKKDLQADISFYQQLLSPNAENKGLRVFQAKIKQQNDSAFHLDLILVQKLERAREIMGTYSIEVIGLLNEESKTIEITKKDAHKFRFKYFHNVSLDISLPEGFKAEQLVVKLFPKIKKAKTIEYKAVWQSLIK